MKTYFIDIEDKTIEFETLEELIEVIRFLIELETDKIKIIDFGAMYK